MRRSPFACRPPLLSQLCPLVLGPSPRRTRKRSPLPPAKLCASATFVFSFVIIIPVVPNRLSQCSSARVRPFQTRRASEVASAPSQSGPPSAGTPAHSGQVIFPGRSAAWESGTAPTWPHRQLQEREASAESADVATPSL